jgi:hypothetical protein
MKLEGEGKLLRIFIGEADKVDHKPLYEVLVRKAHELGLAGATVLRGVESFGAGSRAIHTAKILRLSENRWVREDCGRIARRSVMWRADYRRTRPCHYLSCGKMS